MAPGKLASTPSFLSSKMEKIVPTFFVHFLQVRRSCMKSQFTGTKGISFPLWPSGPREPGSSLPSKSLSLQPSPPKRRELKHAITQRLDGKCFGNFRLHLLLNLILSSVAHYARDGISCGLPGAPHTSRRQPAMLMSLPQHMRGIMRAPSRLWWHPGTRGPSLDTLAQANPPLLPYPPAGD